MARGHSDTPGVIAPPPLLYAIPLIAGVYFNRSNPFPVMPHLFAMAIGGALLLFAIVLNAAAMLQFRRARTSMLPNRPTTAIIDSGPFALTRNPLYLAMTVGYVGIALLTNTAWPLFLLPLVLLVMVRGVIEREERYLEQRFGEEYISYKSRVRRWM